MISIPIDPVLVWMMVFLRTSFLLAFFPLFGEGFVPLRVRILLAVAISFVLTPVVPFGAELFPTSTSGMVAMGLSEALLGVSVGLVGRALFAVVQFSGQIGGEQMGFGLINTIDPTSQSQISVVAELQYLLAILVFLTAGLHHTF
ncbi:MAG: flagellar biosynthetic protein FliR, partial [Planctomycetes bacterium]|nr:flagellar biosynthetic protein FliR [Planctomycetota bacterium]